MLQADEPWKTALCEDSLGRFEFDSKKIINGRVHRKAFEPMRDEGTNRLETSVCDLDGISERRVKHLGNTIRIAEKRTAFAIVEVSKRIVEEVGLSWEAAPEANFPEHAVILGWQSGPEGKPLNMQRQVDIASRVDAKSIRKL